MIERDMRYLETAIVGVTPEQMKKLKSYTYTKSLADEDICSVCLIAAKRGEKVFELVCRHIFHQKCLEPWLKKSTVCPNCRRNVLDQNYLPDIVNPQQLSPPRRLQFSPAAQSDYEESKGVQALEQA